MRRILSELSRGTDPQFIIVSRRVDLSVSTLPRMTALRITVHVPCFPIGTSASLPDVYLIIAHYLHHTAEIDAYLPDSGPKQRRCDPLLLSSTYPMLTLDPEPSFTNVRSPDVLISAFAA